MNLINRLNKLQVIIYYRSRRLSTVSRILTLLIYFCRVAGWNGQDLHIIARQIKRN